MKQNMEKKKIIVISLLIIVLVVVVLSIVMNKTIGNVTFDYEAIGLEEYSFSDDENTVAFQKIQGKIDSINCDYLGNLLILAENTIYEIDSTFDDLNEKITFDKDYVDFFPTHSLYSFLKDKKGNIMGCFYSMFTNEILFEGLDAKDLLYIEIPESDETEEIRVIKKSNNDFYLEKYAIKNQKLEFIDKYELVFRMIHSTEERNDIKNISAFLINGASALITLSDNSAYETDHLFSNIVEKGNKAIIMCSTTNKLSNVSRIYDQDTDFGKIASAYTKTEDKNNIYIYTSKDYVSSDMISMSITLPEGYKTSDIKNIVLNDMSILVEFSDKNIYLAPNIDEGNSEMIFREECSNLNKDDKIMKLELLSYSKIVLLLDNNQLYVDTID